MKKICFLNSTLAGVMCDIGEMKKVVTKISGGLLEFENLRREQNFTENYSLVLEMMDNVVLLMSNMIELCIDHCDLKEPMECRQTRQEQNIFNMKKKFILDSKLLMNKISDDLSEFEKGRGQNNMINTTLKTMKNVVLLMNNTVETGSWLGRHPRKVETLH